MSRTPTDAVDAILEQWRRERPDLELLPMAIFGRLARLFAVGARAVSATLAEHDLNIGEFDVLAALRRAGAPHCLTPGELARVLMLSSGAITNRIDRLEQAGLVERRDDPADRRGVLVALTPAGRERVDVAVTAHVANEGRLLSSLNAREQAELDALLRKLLAALERAGAQQP